MRFQVPQFLEVEDKIFGPLTFKQFIYVAGGVGVAVVAFMFLPKFIAFIIGLPVAAFGAALAFYKVNDKPFINTVEAFLKFQFGSKLYLWNKEENVPVVTNKDPKKIVQVYVPRLSQSKLKDLSWSLDIQESNNSGTKDSGSEI